MSAIHFLASMAHPPWRLLLFTDSLDSVFIFNSLSASENIHNSPLLAIAKIIIQSGINLRPHNARPVFGLVNIDSRALFLQSAAIEIGTTKGYQMGARDYIAFCTKHHLPLDPTPLTLSRYITYSSQYIASAPKYLTDFYPNFDHNRNHPLVQSTIRGSEKIRGDPIKHKLPLRLSHLEIFLQFATYTKLYDNLLFATILSCAFYACHHMGELIIKSDRSQFDCTNILFSKHTSVNPIALLKQYVSLRDSLHHAQLPLFLCEDDYGGHSARAGGATYYASLGLSESIIQAIGRWSSTAWKTYIHDNPTIQAEQRLASIHFHNCCHPT
ncbi:hypothetical protein BYT27DRAFT_7310534 [Phlegmacium glaucopus]|nr:hypothetical protein BYT27DRAFT_7310534 [Phlegmacium glaucopus]